MSRLAVVDGLVDVRDEDGREVDWGKESPLAGCKIGSRALAEIARRHAEGRRAVFDGADLSSCSFRGMDLAGASFVGADLRGAGFTDVNLSGADFSRSRLDRAWLRCAKVEQACFDESVLDGAVLIGGTSIARASLIGARGRYVTFCGVDITGVDMAQVDWTGAVGIGRELFSDAQGSDWLYVIQDYWFIAGMHVDFPPLSSAGWAYWRGQSWSMEEVFSSAQGCPVGVDAIAWREAVFRAFCSATPHDTPVFGWDKEQMLKVMHWLG